MNSTHQVDTMSTHNTEPSAPKPTRLKVVAADDDEPFAPLITFTVVKAGNGSVQSKRHTLKEDGTLDTVQPKFPTSGTFRVVRDTLDNFPNYFKDGSAAVLGVPKGSKVGDVVGLTLKDKPKPGAIPRTKDYFEWVENESVLLFDVDRKDDFCFPPMGGKFEFPELCKLLSETLEIPPEVVNGVAFLGCPSSSAGICLADGTLMKDSTNRHYYAKIKGASPSEALDFIYKRGVILGYGSALVHTDGKVAIRIPIDECVAAPERLDYAADPVLGHGLIRKAKPAKFRPGKSLDLTDVRLKLTDEEEELFVETKDKLKDAPEVLALRAVRIKAYVEKETKRLINDGKSAKQAAAEAEAQGRRMLESPNGEILDIYPKDNRTFCFADGRDVSLGDILANPSAFHGKDLADPLYTDNRRGAARFFHNPATEAGEFEPGRPEQFIINSKRGGGRRFFLHATDLVEPVEGFANGGGAEDLGDEKPMDAGSKARIPPVIAKTLKAVATDCGMGVSEFCAAIHFDATALSVIVPAVALNQNNNKFILLTPGGEYRVFAEKDFKEGCRLSLGAFYSTSKLMEVLRTSADKIGGSEQDKAAFIKQHLPAIDTAFNRHVKVERQFGDMAVSVDMFCKVASIVVDDGRAYLTFPHLRFEEGPIDAAVVADYKVHWPQLDEYIDLLVASRFAAARKKAYVWIHAQSDWGKGFLDNVLAHHGLVVSLSEVELEKLFSGGPVGRQMAEFRRAWVLSINEAKRMPKEAKQLEQWLQFSPKNMPVCRVELYLKSWWSAESIESLASESTGIEDQFANRFSLLRPNGNLDTRGLFSQGRGHYFNSVKAYIGRELNERVDEYLTLGKRGASERGDNFINRFHEQHGIGNQYERLSTKLTSLAQEFLDWIMEEYQSAENKIGYHDKSIGQIERKVHASCMVREVRAEKVGEAWTIDEGHVEVPKGTIVDTSVVPPVVSELYVKTPGDLLTEWLGCRFNQAERGKLTVKGGDVMRLLPKTKSVRYGKYGRYAGVSKAMYVGLLRNE